MPIRKSDVEWEKLGQDDPYFGVISMDKFRKEHLDEEARAAFFKSGAEHVDYVLNTIRNHLVPEFAPKCGLDFGCGVGRCTLPMAQHMESVVGVDVSDSMLTEARRNAQAASVDNILWQNPGSDLSAVEGSFDLIHSFIVFQHIPASRGYVILRQMIDLLSNKGVAALQFLYYRDVPLPVRVMGWLRKRVPGLHGLVNLLHGKSFAEPLMEKNCYNLNRLLFMLQSHGCGNISMHLQGQGKLKSVVIFFQKQPDAVPYDQFYEIR